MRDQSVIQSAVLFPIEFENGSIIVFCMPIVKKSIKPLPCIMRGLLKDSYLFIYLLIIFIDFFFPE